MKNPNLILIILFIMVIAIHNIIPESLNYPKTITMEDVSDKYFDEFDFLRGITNVRICYVYHR